jgi:hypothetical protein
MLVNVTLSPPTWTFALFGSDFEPGAWVLWTIPSNEEVILHDADILSVTPDVVRVLTTQPLVATPGTYSVKVQNPGGEISPALTFQMGMPGVILRPVVGYIHYYGYAYVRPLTPNLTNAPLGLAPGATVTVLESGTTALVELFADQASTPHLNPFLADENGYFSVYLVPVPVDVQFAGGGILTPYTIGDAVPLDPRIPPLEAAVAQLEAAAAVMAATPQEEE